MDWENNIVVLSCASIILVAVNHLISAVSRRLDTKQQVEGEGENTTPKAHVMLFV